MGDDYRGRRLSWREIDRLKDQSGFSRIKRKMERENSSQLYSDPKAKKRYLKELDRLFKSKEDQEREKALTALQKAHGTRTFKKTVKEYIEKYGIPEEPQILLLLLDVEDKKLLLRILDALKERFSSFENGAKQQLISRLKALALSVTDEVVGYKVEKLLKELE